MRTLILIPAIILFSSTFLFQQSLLSLEKNVVSLDYCETTNKIYAGVRTDHTFNFELNVIDVHTGITEVTIPLTNPPYSVKISNNCEFLYVSFYDTSIIRRYELPSLTWDIDIPIPNTSWGDPQFANNIEVFNENPNAIVTILHDLGSVPSEEGLAIFHNEEMTDFYSSSSISEIEIAHDDSKLFGFERHITSHVVSAFDISDYSLQNYTGYYNNLISANNGEIYMEYYDEKLFFSNGKIIDVSQETLTVTQTFPVTESSDRIAINPQSNKIYTFRRAIVFTPNAFAIDLLSLDYVDTIPLAEFLSDNDIDASHQVVKAEARNCKDGFIFYTLNLNLHNPGNYGRIVIYNANLTSLSNVICEGDSILFNNQFLHQEGIYLDTGSLSSFCDTIQKLKLSVVPDEYSFERILCEGEASIIIEGSSINSPGIYVFNHQTQLGCDSVNIYNVELIETQYTYLDTFAVSGQSVFGTVVYSDTTFNYYTISSTGCDSIVVVAVDVVVSTNSEDDKAFVNIFPNPFENTILISRKSKTRIGSPVLRIYSSTGVLVNSRTLLSDSEVLDTSSFPSGVYYFILLSGESIVYQRKVIKK